MKQLFVIGLLLFTAELFPQVTVKAVGDVMLGSKTPREALPPGEGEIFVESVGDNLKGADIVFGNLEGCFITRELRPMKCSEESRKAKRCYEFGMPDYLAPRLGEMGFNVMSLDNNHAEDYGRLGYEHSKYALEGEQIKFAPKQGYAEFTIDSQRVAVVAFGFSGSSYSIADVPAAAQVMTALDSEFDIIIVSFHGGAEGSKAQHVKNETERFYGENRGNLIAFAHGVIDAGADLVIGHGPHVLRAMELYNDRLIAYSLGNFLTYGNMNISGVNGLTCVLEVALNNDGSFGGGKIIPAEQIGRGYPQFGKSEKAIKKLQELTAADFPATPLVIGDDGALSSTP